MNAEEILSIINVNKEYSQITLAVLGFCILVIYLSVVIWLVSDIFSRISKTIIKVLLISIVFVILLSGIFGYFLIHPLMLLAFFIIFPNIFIYLLFRPKLRLNDQNSMLYTRDEIILFENELIYCNTCLSLNRKSFLHCTTCGNKLEYKCEECNILIDPIWQYCPNCSAKLKEKPLPWIKKKYLDIKTFFKSIGVKFKKAMDIKIEFVDEKNKVKVLEEEQVKLPQISSDLVVHNQSTTKNKKI